MAILDEGLKNPVSAKVIMSPPKARFMFNYKLSMETWRSDILRSHCNKQKCEIGLFGSLSESAWIPAPAYGLHSNPLEQRTKTNLNKLPYIFITAINF